MTIQEHVSIARAAWHRCLRLRDSSAASWARYTARIHMQKARLLKAGGVPTVHIL